MPDFTVARRGTDSSGRAIFATAYMWDWWLEVVDVLGFTPTITQGAFMTLAGGGAADSAGFHDKGGAFDLRVWDRTPTEVDLMVRVLRERGAAAWRRNVQHGGFTDPHVHLVLGTDQPLAWGAASQWSDYQNGLDGLASRGRDYEYRPSPLVLTPPEDDMPYTKAELTEIIRAAVKAELESDPQGSDLTRDQLLKQAQKASVEARDMLEKANKRAPK